MNVKSARARVKTRFWGEGSVRAETILTRCNGVDTELEIDSDEEPEAVAKLARLAEAGCYVMQTIRHPTEVNYSVTLNGKALALDTP